jgi:hypothetical protein
MLCPSQQHGIVIIGDQLPGIGELALALLLLVLLAPEADPSFLDLRSVGLRESQPFQDILAKGEAKLEAIGRVAVEAPDILAMRNAIRGAIATAMMEANPKSCRTSATLSESRCGRQP